MQRLSVAIDISISNDKYSLIIDAAELVLQPPLRKPVCNPIIFLHHQKISKQHKLLLAFCGAALSYEQKAEPISGRIIFENRFSSTKVQLASLIKAAGKSELLEKIKSRTFNILSSIYGRIYFPTYSSGLKSIALFLGFNWSDPNASGLQSILWRQQWERSKDKIWNQKIVAYNHEDCSALRMLEKVLQGVANDNNIAQWPTKNTAELLPEKPLGIFKKNKFFSAELERINSCAYFDYQRTKVYCRTNPNIKKSLKRNIRIGIQKLKINKVVTINEKISCPRCQNKKTRIQGRSSRIIYDLKIFNGGIKRWITQYKLLYCYREKCRLTYLTQSKDVPPKLTINRWNRYGKTLMAWAVNQNIARRKSYGMISEDLRDNFGYCFRRNIAYEFKRLIARYYDATYQEM